jgi:formate dehydrogenase major subunit
MPPVFNDKCSRCGICVEDCPGNILVMSDDKPEVVYPDECWHCGSCEISCPCEAVSIQFPLYTFL